MQNWSGKTGGTHWMQRALVGIIRKTDIRFVYGLMHLWLIWYILVRSNERHGAYIFHRRRGRNRLQAALDVYRSFYHFGKAILDRFAAYAGENFEVEVINRELYYGRVNEPQGFVMLFSHVGNTEMAGYFLPTPDKQLHILAYGGESPVVMKHREQMLARNNIGMIPMMPNDMTHIYRISEVIQSGDILSMAADRRMGDHTVTCTFMGAQAAFPAGPFRICQTLKRPVLLVFVIKQNHHSYRVLCEQIEPSPDMAQHFAQRLEQMARTYPYQWFNFYDFWEPTAKQANSPMDTNITEYIPQRPPFVFIDAVEQVDAQQARTSFTVTDACPLVKDGILPLSGLMENAAQTCAARAGNTIGYIGAVKQMNVTRFPHVGETLTTQARVVQEVLNICLMEVTAFIGNELIATTTLKIAIIE